MADAARPVALITGASSGIGAALAREAAKDGHDLVLVARRREPMQALAAELHAAGAEITVISTDLGKPGGAAELMKIVEERGLVIDTLINNAGLGDTGRFDQADPEKISSMLLVNIVALTELTRLILRKWWRAGAARSCSLRPRLPFSPAQRWRSTTRPSPMC